MSELPVNKKDYDRSVCVASFIREVKQIADTNQQISGVLFKPVIKGYEITYKNKGVPERISVNAKSIFFKGLIVRKYVNGKLKDIHYVKEQEICTEVINKVLE